MAHLINQSGNIDDIRNTLMHMPIPDCRTKLFAQILEMQNSITNERENYNRKTVIGILERHIKKLRKAYRAI